MKRTGFFLLAFVALAALPQAASISGQVTLFLRDSIICTPQPPLGNCTSFFVGIIVRQVLGAKIYLLTSATASGPYLKTDSAVTNSSGQYSFIIALTGTGLYEIWSPRQTIRDTVYRDSLKDPVIVNQNDALTQNFLLKVKDILPSGLSYSQNPAYYGVGVAIPPNNPSFIVRGTSLGWYVVPPLPAGLTLNFTTGTISGTPTTLSAATIYIVTASNDYGTTSASVNISVIVGPTGLSYSTNPAQYVMGTAIAPNSPTVTGAVAGYAVTPALPQGLTMNTATGVIFGTPSIGVVARNYTVTATNAQGAAATVTVNITVLGAPSYLSYSVNSVWYSVGKAISPNLAYVQGASPIVFSVSPALPAGLILNTSTGTISGTPTVATPQTNYVVTASNWAGSITVTLGIMTAVVGVFHQPDSRTFTLRISGSSAMVFSLPGNSQVGRLEVLDMKGLKVWESNPGLGNGENTVVWDGKPKGQAISRGLYFARITLMDAKQNPARTIVQRVVYSP